MVDAMRMRRDLAVPGQYSPPMQEHIDAGLKCINCAHREITETRGRNKRPLRRDEIKGKCKLAIAAIGARAKTYRLADEAYGCSRFKQGTQHDDYTASRKA